MDIWVCAGWRGGVAAHRTVLQCSPLELLVYKAINELTNDSEMTDDGGALARFGLDIDRIYIPDSINPFFPRGHVRGI